MTNHLPECEYTDTGFKACICDRLSACEQRVRDAEYSLPEGHPSRDLSYWEAGFAAGIAAAREAVAALESRYDWPAVYGPEALAAIDALVKQ